MKTHPYHSVNPRLTKLVYHDNTLCTEGNNIESHYRRLGTAGRPKCKNC
jgi:hypothetical protein